MDKPATRRRGRHGIDLILLEALATGATHQEVADRANVSLRTVTRRMANPAFRAQLDELHARSFEGITSRLQVSAAAAIETLDELRGSDHPATVRATAARALVTANLQYHDATEVPEVSAQPADSEDLGSKKRRAVELVDEFVRRRNMYFKASQNAGHAPLEPPSCIEDHAAGECHDCRAWQDTAHAIVLEHCIDSEGCLTETGLHVRGQVWPLRAATIQILNVAYRRRPSHPAVA